MPDKRPVIAIDASLTGFCIIVYGLSGIIVKKTIKTKSKGKGVRSRMARYKTLITVAEALVKQYVPEYLFIEGYAFNAKGSSGVTLGEFGGCLRWVLIDYVDNFIEVPPQLIKKFATGKGNANKTAVASALAKRYDMIFESDDESDAFALAKIGAVVAGFETVATRFQLDAVNTVEIALGLQED